MSSSARAARAALEVEIVEDLEGLRGLAREWATLEANGEASFFQSGTWCEHVARMRSTTDCDTALWIGAARGQDGRLMGVWPLAVRRHLGARIAGPLDYPFGQFASILSSNEIETESVVAAILEELASARCADAIILDGVPEASGAHRGLIRNGFRQTHPNVAVAVDLAPFKAFRDYEATISPQSRKSIRTARNRLTRDVGEIRDVVLSCRDEVRPVIEQTFEMRARWLMVNGKTSPAFRDRAFRPALVALVDTQGIELVGFRLEAGGRVLSIQWGFVHMGRYYAYMSARDPEFDRYSPGKLHLGSIIGECHRRGLQTVELMAPTAPYKETWGTRLVPLSSFERALTPRGTVALEGARMAAHIQRLGSKLLPLAAKQRLSAKLSGLERTRLK